MTPLTRRLAAVLAVLVLALPVGCETPRVFDSQAPDPLAELPATRAVVVRPVTIAAYPDDFARRLVEALGEEDIPATTQGDAIRGALVLEARAMEEAGAVILAWTLFAADGREVGRFWQRFDEDVWYAPDVAREAETRDAFIREAAAEVAALLEPPEAARASAVTIAIGAITAPGDGAAALRSALVGQLETRGLVVVPQPEAAAFVLDGAIRARPTGDGRELAQIVWRVRGADGILGTVRQGDVMPAGRLSRTWGPLARDVAVGAADGVVELLRQAGANPPPAPPFTGY